jgi:exopolysaccharide biosynthesis WecB/TagA/CpsF family protein
MSTVFLGFEVQEWEVSDLHSRIGCHIDSGESAEFFNLNAHAVNLAFADSEFCEVLRSAKYLFCDGEGVRWAANLRGGSIPRRITYADWAPVFLTWVASQGYSIFFLGSEPAIIEQAVKQSLKIAPKLRLVGYHDGFSQDQEVIQKIQKSGAQILLVGMGMPHQEKWIRKTYEKLPSTVFLPGGAVFDYLSETVSRAPKMMRNYGFEWLYRFLLEPRRLFTRYVLGLPLYVFRVLLNRMPRSENRV